MVSIPDAPWVRDPEGWCDYHTPSKWDEWDAWWRGEDEEDEDDGD